jgi:hypothetical protein
LSNDFDGINTEVTAWFGENFDAFNDLNQTLFSGESWLRGNQPASTNDSRKYSETAASGTRNDLPTRTAGMVPEWTSR